MRVQRFSAVITAGPRGSGVVVVPFDPDEAWGAKAAHPVGGTIDGSRFRGTVSPGGTGWVVTVSPSRMRDSGLRGLAAGGRRDGRKVRSVVIWPRISPLRSRPTWPRRRSSTLAQFYRKAYLRWIDATIAY
jgi:hypothetical protein